MNKKSVAFWGVFFLVFFLDLITKYLAETLLLDRTVSVIPNLFDLTLVWNKGAAFGMLAEAPEYVRKFILIGSSIVAIIVSVVYFLKSKDKLSNLEIFSLALIGGGSLGNLYDRFFLGQVRDFLDFYIKDHHWPAFNIADASITVGIGLFIFHELYLKKRSIINN
ncbi:signal peptidase II [Sulfurihydrogenibium azorense]|uniref:signal peptidase II n=1 Tax=Sulfurihydrogenibium azorense TaxID=309806 RepID=UPI002409E758|nr:signal peptidase II [Sulfurihydrogenibium azorense]MDM7273464.1 signal peptidase II [Sulfurihydrogenibium azorense]